MAEIHQDDVDLVGPEEAVLKFSEEISKHAQMKWSKVLTEGDYFRFLKQHKYIDKDGIWLYPDDKYAKRISALVGLEEKSKVAGVPISKPRLATDEKHRAN